MPADRHLPEALPCPFCGAQDSVVGESLDNGTFQADCFACCATGPEADSVEEAIAAWNRRAAPAAGAGKTVLAADERDAARYRWLRANKHYTLLVEGFDFAYAQVEHWSNAQNEAKLDAAVDAAMEGPKA